jgi:hypothetical protein
MQQPGMNMKAPSLALAALAGAAALLGPPRSAAAAAPMPNKLIALVRSAGCDPVSLAPRLNSLGRAMAADRRTLRVSIDRTADPARNLDPVGNPSSFAAALEVAAPPAALPALARRVRGALAPTCAADVYLVHERRLLTTPRSWPLGEASPAAKMLITLVRKRGLPAAAFDREWAGPHARLSLAWRAARGGPGHYVQNRVVARLGRDSPWLDGIGETEGPGVPSLQEREARRATAAHARTFQDMDRSSMFVANEQILKD